MAMREDLLQMEVASLPLRPAVTLLPGTSLGHAIELLRANRVGCAFAVDDGGQPRGRLTQATLLRLFAGMHERLEAPVLDQLSPVGECVAYREPIGRLVEAIRRSGDRFICVVNERGQLAGLAGPRSLNEFVASYLLTDHDQAQRSD